MTPTEPHDDGSSTSGKEDEQARKPRECPVCTAMREGGCEAQFDAFMLCGVEAENGKKDYDDCITAFEAMHRCMLDNKEHFKDMLVDVEGATTVNSAASSGGSDGADRAAIAAADSGPSANGKVGDAPEAPASPAPSPQL